ncbi:hypothetical protein W909_02850 [Dickeya zeae EC1]|nr:hypothetical protein W909_02850 [Dickeya zeae EC1]
MTEIAFNYTIFTLSPHQNALISLIILFPSKIMVL